MLDALAEKNRIIDNNAAGIILEIPFLGFFSSRIKNIGRRTTGKILTNDAIMTKDQPSNLFPDVNE